jgi:hypothetical protein
MIGEFGKIFRSISLHNLSGSDTIVLRRLCYYLGSHNFHNSAKFVGDSGDFGSDFGGGCVFTSLLTSKWSRWSPI